MRAVLLTLLLLAACTRGEALHRGSPAIPRDPESRLRWLPGRAPWPAPGEAWERAGARALAHPLPVEQPFQELILLPADSPVAIAYELVVERGAQLAIEAVPEAGAAPPQVDVFEQRGGRPVHALSRRGAAQFEFGAARAGRILLRLQPREGGGGVYRVSVSVRGGGGALVFPVAGADAGAIGSEFGAPRDGGARSHRGVDIFAPRGTPVLAVADGAVQAVQRTPLGGLVIWTSDARSDLSYYYAHLDEQLVRRGMRVSAGDTIGRVGNTGNARGLRPHLHFGVYRPGTIALDPVPLLAARPVTGQLAVVADSVARLLGERALTRGTVVRLRRAPAEHAEVVAELPGGTALRLTGALGEWRRVVLEDGRAGFIAAWLLQPAAVLAQ